MYTIIYLDRTESNVLALFLLTRGGILGWWVDVIPKLNHSSYWVKY